MALDKNFTQNVYLNASGDELLRPLQAFSKEINRVIKQLNGMSDTMTAGGSKSEDSLRKQVQLLQRLIGEANTLNTVLTASSNQKRNSLLSGLDDANMGKRLSSAQKLKSALSETTTATQALELRLGQLRIKFNEVVQAGGQLRNSDISKEMKLEKAINDTKRLERELSLLDLRANKRGGFQSASGADLRADISSQYQKLLSTAQNPNVWLKNVETIQLLIDKVKQLAQAEAAAARESERATVATQRNTLQRINQSDAQLLASVQRGASQFRYTADQARGFDMRGLGQQIDQNMVKLNALQTLMRRAMQPDVSNAEGKLKRLEKYWEQITTRTSEAIAKQKAYNDLPEQRRANMFQSMFGSLETAKSTMMTGLAFNAGFQVFGAIQSAITGGISAMVEFEDQLAQLQAISGATDTEMDELAKSIEGVAANSRFSTAEITKSATALAQAGFSASETGKVLKDAMTLASASGSTPAQSVETMVSALGAFNLQASESGRIADLLVAALNRSKLSIEQVQASLQYAGATAKESGVSLNELVAITASLANAGIRSGSTMGTGIRQLLVDLKKPTDEFKASLKSLGLTMDDVDVKTNGLAGVVKNLTDAGFSAEQAYSSFEVRAASAFLAFRNQIDDYDKLSLALAQQGAAAEANAKSMGSLTAQLQSLKNNLLELLSSGFAPLMDVITVVTTVVGGLISIINEMNQATGGLVIQLGLVAAAFAINPIVGWSMAVATAVSWAMKYADQTERLKAKANELSAEMDSQKQTMSSLDDAMKDLITRGDTLKNNHVALQAETLTLTGRFEGLAGQLDKTKLGYNDLIEAMIRYRGEQARSAMETARGQRITAQQQLLVDQDKLSTGTRRQNYSSLEAWQRMGQSTGNRQYDDIFKFVQANMNLDVSKKSGDELFKLQNSVHARVNDLQELFDADKTRIGGSQSYYYELKRFLDGLYKNLSNVLTDRNDVDTAKDAIDTYGAMTSPQAANRQRTINQTQAGIQSGLKGGGINDPQQVKALLDRAQTTIDGWRSEWEKMDPATGAARVLASDIQALEQQRAALKSKQDAAVREGKDGIHDKPGQRLTSTQVAAEITRLVPEARITDTTRSAARQAGYDRKGGIRRDPNTAPHVNGTALDMAPVKGMDPMEIVSMLEAMGLEVTGAPVKGAAGIRYITPNHGTGPHWHFQWKPKTTRYESGLEQDAAKAARDLQDLLEYKAGSGVKTARNNISTLIEKAKNKTAPIDTTLADFKSLSETYRAARLTEFDTAHPTSGLSAPALEQRNLSRLALGTEVDSEIAKLYETLWKNFGDVADKQLKEALKNAANTANAKDIAAKAKLDDVISYGAGYASRANSRKFGEGTTWLQKRNEEDAQLQYQRSKESILGEQETAASAAVDNYRTSVEATPSGTVQYMQNVQNLRDAEKSLLEIQTQRAAVQRQINEATADYANIPLAERLQNSARAWLDSSGAMDSWGKRAENGVGPILNQLTTGLGDFFNTMATGGTSFGGALKTMLRQFVQFVQQMLLQAVALEAVKAIMGAFGLTFPGTSYGGGIVKKANVATSAMAGTPAYTGGPVIVQGRYGGGTARRLPSSSGRVTQGTPMRDSSLYELAEGEYVVRNKSVRDLGLGFMDTINKHGSAGLAKMQGAGSAFTNIQAPKQETNVYVVNDKQEAGLGPNDVLVTIHKDILQNGVTKRLIRQVAQGG